MTSTACWSTCTAAVSYTHLDVYKRQVFTVEVRTRQLWGVAECRVAGELTPEELTILKEYLGGQASDGWEMCIRDREISTPDSRVKVWVIPTNEELMIARDAYAIYQSKQK